MPLHGGLLVVRSSMVVDWWLGVSEKGGGNLEPGQVLQTKSTSPVRAIKLYRPSTCTTKPPIRGCPLSFVPARFPLPSIPPRWPSWDCETQRVRGSCVPRSSAQQSGVGCRRRKKKAIPYPRLPFVPRSLYRRRRRRLYSQTSPPV